MSKIFDALICKNLKILDGCEFVIADNVAAYYWKMSTQEEWGFDDIPNAAPVFDRFFIEYLIPPVSNSNGRFIRLDRNPWERVGVYFGACGSEDFEMMKNELGLQISQEAKWLLSIFIWAQEKVKLGHRIFQQPFVLGLPISEAGRICGKMSFTSKDPRFYLAIEGLLPMMLYPALLTLSLMHCKNVHIKTETPSRDLSHQYRRKHDRPLVSYKVLEIDPMKRILEHEGGASKTGLQQALHICRGHFKDYTEHGLFGKYKGIYWWDSHVQGNIERGVVTKDYSVSYDRDR